MVTIISNIQCFMPKLIILQRSWYNNTLSNPPPEFLDNRPGRSYRGIGGHLWNATQDREAPWKRRIVRLRYRRGIGIVQPKASFHLGVLKEAGFIKDRKQGKWTHYSLNEVDLFKRMLMVSICEKADGGLIAEDRKRLERFLKSKKSSSGCEPKESKACSCAAWSMKIAVFGEIHGNIEELKAVYDAAMALKPDKIFHLGDVGK